MALKRAVGPVFETPEVVCFLSTTFTTNAASQLDILWHDGHSFGVDGAQVGILEKSDQVGFGSFLQSADSRTLETQVGLVVLSDFTHKTLEWQLADQKLSGLLVTTDLTKSNGTWAVTMRLLDTSSCWCTFACSLGGKLLAGSFSSSRFAGGLFCTGHVEMSKAV